MEFEERRLHYLRKIRALISSYWLWMRANVNIARPDFTKKERNRQKSVRSQDSDDESSSDEPNTRPNTRPQTNQKSYNPNQPATNQVAFNQAANAAWNHPQQAQYAQALPFQNNNWDFQRRQQQRQQLLEQQRQRQQQMRQQQIQQQQPASQYQYGAYNPHQAQAQQYNPHGNQHNRGQQYNPHQGNVASQPYYQNQQQSYAQGYGRSI